MPTRKLIILTGSNGYIGSALLHRLAAAGYRIVDPVGVNLANKSTKWRLGDPVNNNIFKQADAVLHFAHIWRKPDENYGATVELLKTFRSHCSGKFIFASSLSAQPKIRNSYGNVKRQIEEQLTGSKEFSVRIGLVYGGQEKGLWQTMNTIASISPLLLLSFGNKKVYPISIDEVCDGLLSLLVGSYHVKCFSLCSRKPYRFDQIIALIRINKGLRSPFIINVNSALFTLIFNTLYFTIPSTLRDRVRGLARLDMTDSKLSLVTLKLEIKKVFADNKKIKQSLLRESFLILRYHLGHRPSHNLVKQYMQLVENHCNGAPAYFNHCLMQNSFLMAINEPPKSDELLSQRHLFAKYLVAAPGREFNSTSKPRGYITNLTTLLSGVLSELVVIALKFVRFKIIE